MTDGRTVFPLRYHWPSSIWATLLISEAWDQSMVQGSGLMAPLALFTVTMVVVVAFCWSMAVMARSLAPGRRSA